MDSAAIVAIENIQVIYQQLVRGFHQGFTVKNENCFLGATKILYSKYAGSSI